MKFTTTVGLMLRRMKMFNKYVVPDVEEEKARMRALVAKLEENSEEEETKDEEE